MIDYFENEVNIALNFHLKEKGKVTNYLKNQLRIISENQYPIKLGDKEYWINPREVYYIIEQVETNQIHQRKPSIFKHFPLAGLYHTHIVSNGFLDENLKLDWDKNFNRYFSDSIQKAQKRLNLTNQPVYFSEIKDNLIHSLIFQSIENRYRLRQVTGEWLVYAKTSSYKIYLAIASHTEDHYKLIETISTELPFFLELYDYTAFKTIDS